MAGIWDALLSIALQGGGYLLKNRAEEKAADKRSAILREIEALNDQSMGQKLAITQNQVASYAPAQRVAALGNAERQIAGRLQADLVGPETNVDGPVYGGKVSNAFSTAKAQRAADELRYASKLASLMGRNAAPADVALEQSFGNADANTARATVGSDLRGNVANRQLALNAAEPNGGHMMAGDFLQGAGLTVGTAGLRDTSFGAPAQATVSRPSNSPANVVAGRRPMGAAASRFKPGSTAYWTGGRR